MEPTAPTRGQTHLPGEQNKPGRVRSCGCRHTDTYTIHSTPKLEQTAFLSLCPLGIRTATRPTETRRKGPHVPARSTQIRRNFNTQHWVKCRQPCNWISKLMHQHSKATWTQQSHPWVCVVQRCAHSVIQNSEISVQRQCWQQGVRKISTGHLPCGVRRRCSEEQSGAVLMEVE